MKDYEIGGLVLQSLYEHRSNRNFQPKSSDFDSKVDDSTLVRVVGQLEQHGLAEARFLDGISMDRGILWARITAHGVDVIEGDSQADLKIELVQHHNTYNISNSTNVAIGNNNQLTVKHSVEELLKVIESAGGTEQEKSEAKGLLRKTLEHPLLAAVAGAAIGLFD